MRHLRKYYDESGFTEPVEVVEEKLGASLETQFFLAVDNGDGTYSIDAMGQDILFEDGLGFYLVQEGEELVLTKLTSGEAISGTIENEGNVFHYTGYLILNSECACAISIEEYKELLGHEYWLGFNEYPFNIQSSTAIPVVYLGTYHFPSEKQNLIVNTPDIYLVNRPSLSSNVALSMDATNNGDGTYTTKRNGITYSSGDDVYVISGNTAYKVNIGTEPIVFYTDSYEHTGYTYTSPGYGCPNGFCQINDELDSGYTYSLYSGTTENAEFLNVSAYRTNITHPYKEKTEYIVEVVKPGVGYISGKKKVSYNQPKSYASAVTLTISGTSDYACTIPMRGNVLDITQEELRKIAVRFIPDATGNYFEWSECKILFSGITSYTIERDSRSVFGSSISASKSGSNLTIEFGAYDIPNCRNDVLHITFPGSTATGRIKTYYTGAQ